MPLNSARSLTSRMLLQSRGVAFIVGFFFSRPCVSHGNATIESSLSYALTFLEFKASLQHLLFSIQLHLVTLCRLQGT